MARRDQVLSLFGASPAQVLQRIREENQALMAKQRSPQAAVGFGIGSELMRAFGPEDPRVTQARQRQQAYNSVRSELEAGRQQREAAYAEAIGMEGDQPSRDPALQQLDQLNARADQLNALADRFADMGQPMDVVERLRTGALQSRMEAYKLSEDARKNRLAEDEMELRIRRNQLEIEQLEEQRGQPQTLSLSKITGLPSNVLQNYSADSIKAATEVMLRGKQEGETAQTYSQRVVAALEKKPEKAEKPEKPQNFSEFLGIGETLLDSYATDSRLAARKLFAQGKQENETDDQFRTRLLDELNVGLSKQQKERAAELSQSARVGIDGRPAFNKFWKSIDTAITGPLADDMVGLGKFINALGGDIAGIPESEYVKRLLSKETLNSAQFMKGALSDRDIEFLQDTVSRLGNTKEAIKIAFAQLEANKLVDQVVYSAYMSEPDKANFNEAKVVREVQRKIFKRVSVKRGVDI